MLNRRMRETQIDSFFFVFKELGRSKPVPHHVRYSYRKNK